MACCTKKCCLIVGVIAFAILLVVSGLIYVITNPLVQSGMEEEFIVSSENSTRFSYWACKYSMFNNGPCADPHDSVAFEEGYYFFNITNVDEINQGALPKLEQFGPYFYNVDIFKYDIEFVDDGNEVLYGEARTYYWNASLSCAGCRPTDQFVQINAGYLGAVDTAGTEGVLLLGMGGPVIGKMLEDIEATYIASLIAANGYDFWLTRCQSLDAACNSTQDMALVQFGYYRKRAGITPPQIGLDNIDVNEWNSTIFPAEAEYSAKMATSLILGERPLNITQLRKLLFGTKGIVEGPLYLLELIGSATDPEELEEIWGLSPDDILNFGPYILGLADTYDLYLFNEVTRLNQGGGLFSSRTVEQWVFDFKDPLLQYMQPRDPQTAIRYNDTSVEDARSYKPGRMAIRTGKDDSRNVANITMWNGTRFTDFWSEQIPIFGNNQDGQFFFQPTDGRGKLPNKLEDFDIWSPDHGKTIYLEDTQVEVETALTGIKMRRYLLKNSTYDYDPRYFQDIPGFINASFHMNPPFRKRIEFGAKVPLFLSQPRFWAIDNELVNRVEFLNTSPNLEDCATIIDVEPISGNAMGAFKRLQVNFYVAPNVTERAFARFHPNMTTNVMYPVMYITQNILITQDLEDEWNSELGIVLEIRYWIFLLGLILGSIGFVLCVVGLIYASRADDDSRGYTSLN